MNAAFFNHYLVRNAEVSSREIQYSVTGKSSVFVFKGRDNYIPEEVVI